MGYWRRPAFWVLLTFWQAAAFLLAAGVAVGFELAYERAGGSHASAGPRMNVAGFAAHVPLAVCGFFLARNRARAAMSRGGFPVVVRPAGDPPRDAPPA